MLPESNRTALINCCNFLRLTLYFVVVYLSRVVVRMSFTCITQYPKRLLTIVIIVCLSPCYSNLRFILATYSGNTFPLCFLLPCDEPWISDCPITFKDHCFPCTCTDIPSYKVAEVVFVYLSKNIFKEFCVFIRYDRIVNDN